MKAWKNPVSLVNPKPSTVEPAMALRLASEQDGRDSASLATADSTQAGCVTEHSGENLFW